MIERKIMDYKKVDIYTDGACSRKPWSTADGEQFLFMEKIEKKYQDLILKLQIILWK